MFYNQSGFSINDRSSVVAAESLAFTHATQELCQIAKSTSHEGKLSEAQLNRVKAITTRLSGLVDADERYYTYNNDFYPPSFLDSVERLKRENPPLTQHLESDAFGQQFDMLINIITDQINSSASSSSSSSPVIPQLPLDPNQSLDHQIGVRFVNAIDRGYNSPEALMALRDAYEAYNDMVALTLSQLDSILGAVKVMLRMNPDQELTGMISGLEGTIAKLRGEAEEASSKKSEAESLLSKQTAEQARFEEETAVYEEETAVYIKQLETNIKAQQDALARMIETAKAQEARLTKIMDERQKSFDESLALLRTPYEEPTVDPDDVEKVDTTEFDRIINECQTVLRELAQESEITTAAPIVGPEGQARRAVKRAKMEKEKDDLMASYERRFAAIKSNDFEPKASARIAEQDKTIAQQAREIEALRKQVAELQRNQVQQVTPGLKIAKPMRGGGGKHPAGLSSSSSSSSSSAVSPPAPITLNGTSKRTGRQG